jgi:hypothetical protein
LTVHTTTLTAHARSDFYGVPACPCCGAAVPAPETSVLFDGDTIHHHWSCDDCAHPFATVIALDLRARQPVIVLNEDALCPA